MKHPYDGYTEEWNKLHHLAYAYLKEPHSIPKAEDIRRWLNPLRLWHYPAFAEHRSWSIYQRTKPSERITKTLLRQVTWNRPSDAERLFEPMAGLQHGLHPQPTIEVRDRPVSTEEFKRRLAPLPEISFQLFASGGIGIDGESFGVEYPCGRAKAEWWCEGPDSWSELSAWAKGMREWLSKIAEDEPDRDLWEPPKPRLP